jgi:predicted Zn-dependent peptidase
MSSIITRELDCGAALVVEPIPSVASVALNWLLPVGAATDASDGDGMAAMLGELVFRGAGDLDSRGHSDALDRLGVQRSSQVLTHHLRLTATLVGDRLRATLPLLANMVVRPALPADALEAVRSLCLQALDGLDDDPQQLVMLHLRERHLPRPFHRHGYGDRSVLERCAIEPLRASWAQRCRPGGSILAAAGAVDPDALTGQLNELLAGWTGSSPPTVESGRPPRGHTHMAQDTAQMHLGLAYDAPREADPESMRERLGVGVLSGGTSARLFTEVRQKRSLCYSVGASYGAGRDYGVVTLYAGTTPERAQETLDVCSAEIERLKAGVTAEELDRTVVGLKSRLVMQGESTAARAAAIGSDHFRLGRARSLDELVDEIDAVTLGALNDYLSTRQFGEMTAASVGSVELENPGQVSISPAPDRGEVSSS